MPFVLTHTARDFGVLFWRSYCGRLAGVQLFLDGRRSITKMMTSRSTVPERSGSCRLLRAGGKNRLLRKCAHPGQMVPPSLRPNLPATVEAVEATMSLMRCCEGSL